MRSYLGKVVWRDTAMTITHGPIDALTAEVRSRSAGKEGRMAMDRFTHVGIDTGDAGSPIELASLCHRPGEPDFARTVIAGLVRLAPDDEIAALTALVALRPALIGIAHRLVGLGVPTGEAQVDVIAAAWEALQSQGGRRTAGRTAGKLVAATWNACRAESRRVLQHRGAQASLSHMLNVAERGSDPAERVSTVLFDARCHGVLSRAQAALVYDTRILDRSIDGLAASLGGSPWAVRKRRERIEARLRAFVADSDGEVAS